MTDYRHLNVEERGEIAVIQIDRPPANAMDLELLEEGRRLAIELTEREPAAVVITGREGYFSAGLDLKVVPNLDRAGQRTMVEGVNGLFASWYAFPRPVVCAVNGHAIAGGLILALCGDYRVGVGEGKLGLTELRVGVPYPAVALEVVRAELGPRAARELVLRAALVDPGRALELGILDEMVDSGGPLDRAIEVASELAALPAATYAVVKRQLRGDAIAANERVVTGGGEPLLESWLGEETPGAAAGALG